MWLVASKLSKPFNLPICSFLLGCPVPPNLGSTGRDRRAHKRKWSGTHVNVAIPKMFQSGKQVEGGIDTSQVVHRSNWSGQKCSSLGRTQQGESLALPEGAPQWSLFCTCSPRKPYLLPSGVCWLYQSQESAEGQGTDCNWIAAFESFRIRLVGWMEKMIRIVQMETLDTFTVWT